ncbi:uncharacterized protein EV154DRAFT_572594 [Mucor mucedo]|uniref:uncharacterized protein n=1 Tax=Mucor mucedo TaxID=29922 RepID=UPI00221E984A|nr:uncharacterized protein EV154DRAFT_572594 [Mucor mucedo]KAI7864007.1 hypothetical protein EV154DRAFT_572594 [Mucor mucedo]
MNSLNLNNSAASGTSGSDSAGNSIDANPNPGSPIAALLTGTSTDATTSVNLPQSSAESKPMEIDNLDKVEHSSSSYSFTPSSFSDPVVTHVFSLPIPTPVRNTFDEDADQILARISDINKFIRELYEKETTIMRTDTSTIPEFQIREYKIKSIAQDLEYYRKARVSANSLFASFKDTSVNLLANQTQILSFESQANKVDIPVFDVSFPDHICHPDIYAVDDHSLQTFIRKFERAYLNYGVNIELHWLFHLEASFENNNSYNSWLIQNFKSTSSNKPKTWNEAKATLECRFDPVARLVQHMNECAERKKFLENNTINNPEDQMSSELLPLGDDNEFLAAYNSLDSFIIHDNDELESNNNNTFFNKNIFSIKINSDSSTCLNNFSLKSNTVGDTNNPFDSNNVAYSPVTPIIINSVKSYCTIDTGAQIFVMNKQFAVDNNIQFKQTEGSLLFAYGTKIQRQRTTQFLSLDYNGVEKQVLHKFDIVDNKYLSSSNQILIGMDLLPKFNIHLLNVAHKFKDTTEQVDDSIDDQAYVPNVTPFGTEKEQHAFTLALTPYIGANKALN